jgi:hypothetical protein
VEFIEEKLGQIKNMIKFEVYKDIENAADIFPLSGRREWMDDTAEKHAYRCFPVTLTNQLGWGISFPEDITFMWDGIISTYPDNVKILQGQKYCSSGRGNASIQFHTGLTFKTDKDYSLLSMPVPNKFIDGITPYTTLMSSSFFEGELPVVWRITKPFTPITIKAGEPIISVFPISLTNLQNTTLTVKSIKDVARIPKLIEPTEDGARMAAKKTAENGGWTDYYRDGVDYMGNDLGNHEVKAIKLKLHNEITNEHS